MYERLDEMLKETPVDTPKLSLRERLERHKAKGHEGGSMQRFYMVYAEGKSAPTYKHSSLEKAEAEAQRIARLGQKTYVLLALSQHEPIVKSTLLE